MTRHPNIQANVSLAPYTSFEVGGEAEYFAEVHNTEQLITVLSENDYKHIWLIGYGSNVLVSDKGLPGLTVCIKGGEITVNDDNTITADAGVWWDDVVKASIDKGLWGAELMSEIPGSVGAATFINITAYGQSIGPLVQWVEVWNPASKQIDRIEKEEMKWDYKSSIFQTVEYRNRIILRVCIQLQPTKTDELTYQRAVDVAQEQGYDLNDLRSRREVIIEARRVAGSLWDTKSANQSRTAGSFFRNPIVAAELAEAIMSYDETGKTKEQIKLMNKVHGGTPQRVSAAHVMLAAGFSRGQTWDDRHVKLNDKNLLKIEALPGATALDVYDVVEEIQAVCLEKLGIKLEPEAQILGEF